MTGLYAGGGFQLIHRSALEKMVAAYPETRFNRVHDLPMSGSRRDVVRSSNLFALFDCIIDPESGAYLSEDYSFCLRWRRIGGEIWLDAASKLNHSGPYEFVGDHARGSLDTSEVPDICDGRELCDAVPDFTSSPTSPRAVAARRIHLASRVDLFSARGSQG